MYDELERLHRTFLDWVKASEETILRGTLVKDFEDYRVRVATMNAFLRAAKEVEALRTRMLQEEIN